MAGEQATEKSNGTTPVLPKEARTRHPTPTWAYVTLLAIIVISYIALPNPLQPHHGEEPSIQHVFYYGWLTAVSTGLGAVPLVFAPDLSAYWVGISNCKFNFGSFSLMWWGALTMRFCIDFVPFQLQPSQLE